MEDEKDSKFQNELSWCIERLEETMNSGKLNEKKAKDSYKTLMALQNPKTSFIKKRQLMRATFGDYRSKIAKEEKDIKFKSSVTLGDCSRAKKSKYLKMKQCTSSTGRTSNISSDSSHLNIDQTNIADISTELSERLKASDLDDKTEGQETGFRFNFKVDSMATSSTKNVSEEVISKPEANNSQHPKLSCKGLKYAASDNSFRFNFPS